MNSRIPRITEQTKETYNQVVSAVEKAFNVKDIFQRSNSPKFTICRAVACYILKERKGLRVSEICALSGMKNHSRVLYYIDEYGRESFRNKRFQKLVQSVKI